MGTFRVTIEVGDPAGASYREVSMLVDSGASYSQVPDSILRALGVAPHTRRTFQLADGRQVERDVGQTWIRHNGLEQMTLVVFGTEDSEAVLGAVTLEELGLAVDPLNGRLIPVPGLLMVALFATPMTTIQVDNEILLRPPRMSDAEDLFALVDSNREYLRRWAPLDR